MIGVETQNDELLSIQLALDEFEDCKALGKSASTSDFALAASMMRQELSLTYESMKLARSLSNAPGVPEAMLRMIQQQDEQEEADRQYALSLMSAKDSKCVKQEIDGVKMKTTASFSFDDLLIPFSSMGIESSSKSVVRKAKIEPCVSCFDPSDVKSACVHFYCIPCIRELCLAATKDISLFPARCCKQVVPQEHIEKALKSDEFATYKERQLNLAGANIANIDPGFQNIVQRLGWKICPGCGAGIEKTAECNHMTCAVCRTEFCYTCGAKWVPRECNCALWTEQELARVLQEVAPRAGVVERQRLRQVYQHHDQHVHSWAKLVITDKYKKCRSCRWVCNQWYWRCEECATNSCGTCAFNR